MLSREVCARLEDLNRQRLPPALGVQSRDRVEAAVVRPVPPAARVAAPILATGIEVENAAGRYLRIDRPLCDLWPGDVALPGRQAQRRDAMTGALPQPPLRLTAAREAELAALAHHFPHGTLFLDLETCGFAGSMIFLVGLVCRVGDQLVLRQLLSRNYAEERAMLAALWPLVAAHPLLCTFNGKAFDWPMIHDRSTLHRLGQTPRRRVITSVATRTRTPGDSPGAKTGNGDPAEQPAILGPRDPRPQPLHLDILHHARRRWRASLPNCRLQTLETYLCRRRRSGDIPGSEIPPAYHEFVRSGDPRRMDSILHHNALDLVTLAQLAERLL